MTRPDWDKYFFNIAEQVAKRSSCIRNKVGAVIVNDKDIISTGYNGAPKYQKNCEEIGFCYRQENNIKSGENMELCRAIGSHAETNAIALAAKHGHSTDGCTMYVIGHSYVCTQCKAQIANAGITKVLLKTPIEEQLTKPIYQTFYPQKDWTIHPIDKEST